MNSHLRQDIKELVLLSLLGAILVIIKEALSSIPNVELVSLFIFVYAVHFKWKSLYPVYIFVVMEGVLYGFGTWWFGYLYVWLFLAVIPITLNALHVKISSLVCALSLLIYGIAFGFLFAVEYALIDGINAGYAYWISGVYFDLIHAVSNMISGFILFKPLDKLFKYMLAKF